jgi:hypothetical protein
LGVAGDFQGFNRRSEMRIAAIITLAIFGLGVFADAGQAQQSNSCKVCRDQQQACMKNYAGPTCKTEYQMCTKSCKK